MKRDNTSNIDNLVVKLESIIDSKSYNLKFDDEDIKLIRDMMKAYNMFLSWGKLGRIIIWLTLTGVGLYSTYRGLD